jgi:hypothetical protein
MWLRFTKERENCAKAIFEFSKFDEEHQCTDFTMSMYSRQKIQEVKLTTS